MKDVFKGLGVVTALLIVLVFAFGSIGCYIELNQLQDDCTALGYGGYYNRDGRVVFFLFDDPAKSKTKADKLHSETRPCGELAGRKVKMASQ